VADGASSVSCRSRRDTLPESNWIKLMIWKGGSFYPCPPVNNSPEEITLTGDQGVSLRHGRDIK